MAAAGNGEARLHGGLDGPRLSELLQSVEYSVGASRDDAGERVEAGFRRAEHGVGLARARLAVGEDRAVVPEEHVVDDGPPDLCGRACSAACVCFQNCNMFWLF